MHPSRFQSLDRGLYPQKQLLIPFHRDATKDDKMSKTHMLELLGRLGRGTQGALDTSPDRHLGCAILWHDIGVTGGVHSIGVAWHTPHEPNVLGV